jgi:hypothetical protein
MTRSSFTIFRQDFHNAGVNVTITILGGWLLKNCRVFLEKKCEESFFVQILLKFGSKLLFFAKHRILT